MTPFFFFCSSPPHVDLISSSEKCTLPVTCTAAVDDKELDSGHGRVYENTYYYYYLLVFCDRRGSADNVDRRRKHGKTVRNFKTTQSSIRSRSIN